MKMRLLLCACAAVLGCERATPPPAPAAGSAAGALFLRGTLAFDIAVKGEGAAVVSELTKFAKLFGYAVVGKDEQPGYVLRGDISLVEIEPVKFEDHEIQYKHRLDAKLELVPGAGGAVLEPFELPEFTSGAADKERAPKSAVRDGATKLAQFIFYDGAVLGDPELRTLCGDLVVENVEGRLYNDVVERLVAIGDRAVPFLIWSMNDSRKVALKGDLPRLEEKNADKVRVHHVANYALERIFGFATAMSVESSASYVRELMVGWQAQWHARCAAYLQGDKLKEVLQSRAPAAKPGAK